MSVTEEDRERALSVINGHGGANIDTLLAAFAQIRADERERARAPFRELADELDDEARSPGYAVAPTAATTQRYAAARIRAALATGTREVQP